MKSMGLQTYRFSTSWSRVRPDGGAVNLEGRRLLQATRRRAARMPASCRGSRCTTGTFRRRCRSGAAGRTATPRTGSPSTRSTCTTRSATGSTCGRRSTSRGARRSSATPAGVHAPGHYSAAEGMLAAHHLLLGHGQAVRELRARDASLEPRHHAEPHRRRPGRPDRPGRRRRRAPHRRPVQPLVPRPDLPRRSTPPDIVDGLPRGGCRAARSKPRSCRATSRPSRRPIDTLGVNYYHGEYVGGHAPEVPPRRRRGADRPSRRARRSRRRRASTGTSAGCRAPPWTGRCSPRA